MAAIARAKTFIRFSTQHARELVHSVLKPHPAVGLRAQDIYERIHTQFPDAKEKEEYLPKAVREESTLPGTPLPPNKEHPIRSMNYLKRIVLPEMEKLGEVKQISLQQGVVNAEGVRLDRVKYSKTEIVSIPTDMQGKQEWRWRLVPGQALKEIPDPILEDVISVQSATVDLCGAHSMRKKARERRKEDFLRYQLDTFGRRLR